MSLTVQDSARKMCLLLGCLSLSPLFALVRTYQQGVDGYRGCEDTYMIEYRLHNNYGDAIYIECQSDDGREGGSEMRPLIRFSDLGLAGLTVRACTLQLYCYFSVGDSQVIQLHSVLRNWEEFGVTWHLYRMDSAWTDPGCGLNDEDASIECVFSIADSLSNGWKTFPIPTSLAQQWVDAPGDTNNGLLIWSPETGTIKDRSFRSGDMFTPSLRPKLIIHYTSVTRGDIDRIIRKHKERQVTSDEVEQLLRRYFRGE